MACEDCKRSHPYGIQCPHEKKSLTTINEELRPRSTNDLFKVPDYPISTDIAKYELEIQQAQSLHVLAKSVEAIANFLSGGGLVQLLSGYARAQSVKDILGGLATHSGRDALDARTIKQNALEIAEVVEACFEKYQERLAAKNRDPEIHAPPTDEDAYQKWKKEKEDER